MRRRRVARSRALAHAFFVRVANERVSRVVLQLGIWLAVGSRHAGIEDHQVRLLRHLELVTSEMAQLGLLSRESRHQVVQLATREAQQAVADRDALAKLLLVFLRAMRDGLVHEPTHYLRGEGNVLALHPESLLEAVTGAHPDLPGPTEIRRLFRVGQKLVPEVILGSQRVLFGAGIGRRRGVLLSEPHAHALALRAK